MKTNVHLWSYLSQFFSEWEMFQTVLGKIKTHILYSITFFENRTVYEIMWKNIVDPDRTQMTLCRMRIACWITKVIDTHSECVILLVFPQQQWLRERTSLLSLYLHSLSCCSLHSKVGWTALPFAFGILCFRFCSALSDCFLCGWAQEEVYWSTPRTFDKLVQNIRDNFTAVFLKSLGKGLNHFLPACGNAWKSISLC
jgi:hypothetical protein